MSKFLQSFKDKRLRYGAFSTLTALFVVAILIVVNLLAGQLNLSYDLTSDKLYSLSDSSKTALADINEDVVIYSLLKTGATDYYIDIIRELLDEYPGINSHIRLEYKDPYLYPQFVERFNSEEQDIPVGSVIVEGAGRFKVIPVGDLVTQDVDYQTFQSYISSVNVEPQVTNAILYVVNGETPVVYVLGGHNEMPLADSLKSQITAANYKLRDLNLFNSEIPEDCDVLFVTTPERDWTAEETAAVRDYLENDGRAVVFMDFTTVEFPNLEGLLAGYGVELERALIFEGDPNRYFLGLPWNIVPGISQHEITQTVYDKGYPNVVPMAMPLREAALKRQTVTVTPIMATSESAYAKTNLNSQSIDKEPGDIDGPFVISAAIEEHIYIAGDHTTKLVVTAAGSILDESINSEYVMGANYDFVLGCLSWTQDTSANIYISPKTGSAQRLMMTAGEAFMLIGISLVIPVAILMYGVGVWLRRRKS